MENETMLTTFDNPYNPFEDFTSWFLFDVEKGYNTCGYIARIVNLSDDLSEVEVNNEIDKAFDAIIDNDFLNLYRKVSKDQVVMGTMNS